MAFPNESLYTTKLNEDIRQLLQSGLINKIVDEVRWEMQRSPAGHLLSVKEHIIIIYPACQMTNTTSNFICKICEYKNNVKHQTNTLVKYQWFASCPIPNGGEVSNLTLNFTGHLSLLIIYYFQKYRSRLNYKSI